ncbi:MAG: PEP/pyruvate-binding domain-containing protein, partial [Marinicella sp.]
SFTGTLPAALKAISKNKKALDWQLQSLERADIGKINFIGGYHVQEVIEQYPQLSYTIAPDWRNSHVIHSLLLSPFRAKLDALILYSDTLFRPKTIEKFSHIDADVVIGVDSQWLTRFEHRSDNDISSSEVLNLYELGCKDGGQVEFTGLLKLSATAVNHVKKTDPQKTSDLVALIKTLYQAGFKLKFYDVKGDWAEFNSDLDVAHFILGTKSETLYRLFPLVNKSVIGEQVTFTVSQWRTQPEQLIEKIRRRFKEQPLVIRSSSFAEDCWDESHAGGFESVLNVDSRSAEKIIAAVDDVIASYQHSKSLEQDQILVQECLSNVKMSGVVFTRSLETGAPYYRINFDDQTQSTESVTSGTGSQLRTVIVSKEHSEMATHLPDDLRSVLNGVSEIEALLGYDKLDIEFAIDASDQLHVFQVRPIAVSHQQTNIEDQDIKIALDHCVTSFYQEQHKGPNQIGSSTYFGVMPDWNPAEIIGVKPKPLAYSLYRHLIVDQIWAVQRAEFGYRDISQYPLIRTFIGQPYVNIRNSLNSFIPASVSEKAAERICNAYLAILKEQPHLHDKIEFDVAFTVLSPQFDTEVESRFQGHGVTSSDVAELRSGLLDITQKAFSRLADDLKNLNQLEISRDQVIKSELTEINQALLLLEDCKKYGTLAFSHAARAGFVAMTFLNSLVQLKVIGQDDKDRFLSSFDTVAGEFEHDAKAVGAGRLSKQEYIDKYGHLRPGTYDITAQAYWENPEQYLFSKKSQKNNDETDIQHFELSAEKQEKINLILADMGMSLNALELLTYCRQATQAREYVKFQFSKNLSKALDLMVIFGQKHGIKRKQLAYLNLSDLREFSLGVQDVNGLKKGIKAKKKKFALTKMIELPQLILAENDFYAFERNASEPNYVTSKSIEADCIHSVSDPSQIEGKIVFIEQADPGYDWMFAYKLAGLITKYGGANSHMAIRSAELNLPAAIGVGDKIYDEFKSASIIRLNCGLKQIIRIK